MTERWQRVGELFDRIVTALPEERTRLLNASDASNDIKEEVRSLLAAHDAAADFLDPPAASLAPDDPALHAGQVIGPYRVVGVLGRGGMGVVYEAEDTRLQRRVALKALPPEVASDERQRARLRHEARAAAALQHPGIATVYALEELDGQLFISSEYLAGHTLREEIRVEPPSVERALISGIALARALCAAHERGVVHRDLKPENIVRTPDGTLKILDFGLARIEHSEEDVEWRSRLTLTGALVGTPAYMAPEQLIGRRADARVDHFALGILLYELCTGKHPFAASSLPATLARTLADVPDPPDVEIPAAIWNVIERCLAKAPEDRFSSTRDLLAALESCQPGHLANVPPVSSGIMHSAAEHTPTRSLASESPRRNSAAEVAASTKLLPLPGAVERKNSPSNSTPRREPAPVPLTWWRFHQFAAAAVYWAMVGPVWHVHRAFGRAGLFFFFTTLAAVVVAAVLRLHLWFSSRVYPEDLSAQRTDVARWVKGADVAFSTLLIVGGIALPDTHAGWAALMISVGVGAALSFLFIEPATARAAFRQWPRPDDGTPAPQIREHSE